MTATEAPQSPGGLRTPADRVAWAAMSKKPPAELGAPTFEQAYTELNAIVSQLETAELPLEQALALHARGQQLAKLCADLLDKAELRLRQIDLPAADEGAAP